jgi:hypothetical protein
MLIVSSAIISNFISIYAPRHSACMSDIEARQSVQVTAFDLTCTIQDAVLLDSGTQASYTYG